MVQALRMNDGQKKVLWGKFLYFFLQIPSSWVKNMVAICLQQPPRVDEKQCMEKERRKKICFIPGTRVGPGGLNAGRNKTKKHTQIIFLHIPSSWDKIR